MVWAAFERLTVMAGAAADEDREEGLTIFVGLRNFDLGRVPAVVWAAFERLTVMAGAAADEDRGEGLVIFVGLRNFDLG